jgi:hypothetical protein
VDIAILKFFFIENSSFPKIIRISLLAYILLDPRFCCFQLYFNFILIAFHNINFVSSEISSHYVLFYGRPSYELQIIMRNTRNIVKTKYQKDKKKSRLKVGYKHKTGENSIENTSICVSILFFYGYFY